MTPCRHVLPGPQTARWKAWPGPLAPRSPGSGSQGPPPWPAFAALPAAPDPAAPAPPPPGRRFVCPQAPPAWPAGSAPAGTPWATLVRPGRSHGFSNNPAGPSGSSGPSSRPPGPRPPSRPACGPPPGLPPWHKGKICRLFSWPHRRRQWDLSGSPEYPAGYSARPGPRRWWRRPWPCRTGRRPRRPIPPVPRCPGTPASGPRPRPCPSADTASPAARNRRIPP